jgi:hypothetical protein
VTGQESFLAGHCPLTSRYFDPWMLGSEITTLHGSDSRANCKPGSEDLVHACSIFTSIFLQLNFVWFDYFPFLWPKFIYQIASRQALSLSYVSYCQNLLSQAQLLKRFPCVCNRLVASLSTSCDNAVISSSCYKVVTNNLLTNC